ncbi:MAG: glycosyltransferase [Ignavibacteriales bacterium]|nr:MAG: glycosyltransferase [Ignavibacteriales bacterium]
MKTAIVHDWFASYAGSEKCVESFTNIWTDADVFTLFNLLNYEESQKVFKNKNLNTSFLQKAPFIKTKHRNYLPFFPYAIEQFDVSGYDFVLTSSHAVAKGVITNSDQLNICYCYTPIRYAWDLYHQYLKAANLTSGIKGFIAKNILHYIRMWDSTTANRVNYFVGISHYIAKRIEKIYGRKADVIYPPVDTKKFECSTTKDDYYLAASRFVPYKKIDLIVETFKDFDGRKLVLIGDGPDQNKIRALLSKNVEYIGYQPDVKLKEYMQKAKAFIFAAEEDFGIIPVEALSCGTPVIAFNKGGASETIIDGESGIHFNEQSITSLREAILKFEKNENKFDSVFLNQYAKKFDRKVFEENITRYVDEKSNIFFNRKNMK